MQLPFTRRIIYRHLKIAARINLSDCKPHHANTSKDYLKKWPSQRFCLYFSFLYSFLPLSLLRSLLPLLKSHLSFYSTPLQNNSLINWAVSEHTKTLLNEHFKEARERNKDNASNPYIKELLSLAFEIYFEKMWIMVVKRILGLKIVCFNNIVMHQKIYFKQVASSLSSRNVFVMT